MRKLNVFAEPVTDADIRNLEGKLLTLVEAIGIPEKQENAVKSQIKNVLWDRWADYCDREILYYNGSVYKISEEGVVSLESGYQVPSEPYK